MMRDRVMPYQIHNYGHNNEWLVRSFNHTGRVHDALSLARNMLDLPRHPDDNSAGKSTSIAGYGTRRLISTCHNYELSQELAELYDAGLLRGGASPRRQLAVAVDLGRAFSSMGDIERARAQIAALERLRKTAKVPAKKQAKAKANKKAKPKSKTKTAKSTYGGVGAARKKPPESVTRKAVDERLAELRARVASAEGRHQELRKLLAAPSLKKLKEQQWLADAWLQIGDTKKGPRSDRCPRQEVSPTEQRSWRVACASWPSGAKNVI